MNGNYVLREQEVAQTRYDLAHPEHSNLTGFSNVPPTGQALVAVEDPALMTERRFLLAMRQGLLIQLGAIEALLGLPRSVVPKRKR